MAERAASLSLVSNTIRLSYETYTARVLMGLRHLPQLVSPAGPRRRRGPGPIWVVWCERQRLLLDSLSVGDAQLGRVSWNQVSEFAGGVGGQILCY